MGCRSDSRANTVEVVSSLDDWKLPGFKLERYQYGEFACFLGQQKFFGEVYFKVSRPAKLPSPLMLMIRIVRYRWLKVGN